MGARFGDARVDVASFGSGREEFRELCCSAGQLFPFPQYGAPRWYV